MVLFRQPDLRAALVWFGIGALLFCLASARLALNDAAVGERSLAAPFRWRAAVAGVAVEAGAAVLYARGIGPEGLQVLLWGAGPLLWLASVVPNPRGIRGAVSVRRPEALFLVVVFVATLVSRLVRTDVLPLNVHGDMASYGLQARELIEGVPYDFFGVGWAGIPIIGYWMTALPMAIWGEGLVGLNVFPAVAASATLVGLYLLTREMLGWRVAVLATLFAFGDIMLIHYGRIVAYIDPVPFIAWMMFFLVYAFRHGARWAFACAGIMAGFAMHTYYSGRISIFLAAAVVVIGLISVPDYRRRSAGLVIAGVAFLLVLGPAIVFNVEHLDTFTARSRDVAISSPGVWTHTASKYGIDPANGLAVMWQQLNHSALAFWRYNDGSTQFGIERNLLDPIEGVLLILGLGCCLIRVRKPFFAVLLVWLAGYVAAGALSVDPPFSGRLVGQSLPSAIIAAVAIETSLVLFASLVQGRRWKVAAFGVGVLVVLASVTTNWRAYIAWGTDGRYVMPASQIARFLWRQPTVYPVVFVSRAMPADLREFEFLLSDRERTTATAENIEEGGALPDGPAIFILDPDAYAAEPALAERYPNGVVVDGSMPPTHGVFHAFFTANPEVR